MKVIVGKGIIEQKELPKKRNFTNFLAAYHELTEDQEASQKIHHWTALSVLAGALERKVWLDRGHYKMFPNIYVMIVGAPGLVKKSTATSIGVNLLREIPEINFLSEQITDASLIDAMHRANGHFLHQGKDIKQSAVYFYGSELSVALKNAYGSVPELLTTFFDCQPCDSSKPWSRETKANGRVNVYGPCLNMLGCTTPTWLKDSIPVDQMEGGFASRILFVFETSLPTKFVAIPRFNPAKEVLRQKLIEDLRLINSLTGEMRMTKYAEEIFTDFYEKNLQAIVMRGDDTRFAGYFGRKPTMVEKLAMLYSVEESDSLLIEDRHVGFAIDSLNTLEAGMLESMGFIGKSKLTEPIYRTLRYLAKTGAISSSELHAMHFHALDPREVGMLMEQLLSLGVVTAGRLGNEGMLLHVKQAVLQKLLVNTPVVASTFAGVPDKNFVPEPLHPA